MLVTYCPNCTSQQFGAPKVCADCGSSKNSFLTLSEADFISLKQGHADESGRKKLGKNQLKGSTPATLEDLVAAQNRTTHAVRAFVRFLFIQLSATTMAVFIYTFSSSNVFLRIIAIVVWLGGVAISSSAGWSELEASNLPS
jgi:hypothetical protein